MKKSDIDRIKKAAAEKYDGDLDVAIAAHIMGDHVIAYCAGKIPSGADTGLIAEIRAQIEGPKAKGKSKKAKAPAA